MENLENKKKKRVMLWLIALILGGGIGFGINKISNVNSNIIQKEKTNSVDKKQEKEQQGDKYFISKLRNAKMDDIVKVGETEYKVVNIDKNEVTKKIEFIDTKDETSRLYVIRELEDAEIPLTSISFLKSKSLEEKDYGTYFNFDTTDTNENEESIITIEDGMIEKNELSSKTLKIELTKENLEKVAEMLSVKNFNFDDYKKLINK